MTVYLLDTATNDTKQGQLGFGYSITKGGEDCAFTGQPRSGWQPMPFQWFLKPNQKRKNLVINDFVLITGAGADIALSEKVKKILEPVLGHDAQYLPIDVDGETPGSWYLLNTLHVLSDAIDYQKSHYFNVSTGDRILTRPVFIENKIPDNRIFVYPNAYNRVGVKGEFLKELVAAHKLTGLQFHPCETIESGPLSKSAAG